MGKHRYEAKRRKRQKVHAFRSDQEAVRAVVSARAFQGIEELRSQYPAGVESDATFWRAVREKTIEQVRKLSNPADKLVTAKVAAVCAMHGMRPDEIKSTVHRINVSTLVAAAHANECIQDFQKDAELRSIWADDSIRTNPPMRVEFEHAIVLGSISEAGDIAKNKNWGKLLRIESIRESDFFFPRNITYMLKDTSTLRMRWEFRDTFKQILRDRRDLVNDAMRNTKRFFLESLHSADITLISNRLGLSAGDFWRAVRHGERFGPGGIERFVKRLEEQRYGYSFDFEEPPVELVQITGVSK